MELQLPSYQFRLRAIAERKQIFDTVRRRWVALTPEEWVRQHFVRYLVEFKHFPSSLIAVEQSLKINQRNFRADIVLFSKSGKPVVVVECKAPTVKIGQDTFDQIARYNLNFLVDYLIVTNGISHYCCQIDKVKGSFQFLKEVVDYGDIVP